MTRFPILGQSTETEQYWLSWSDGYIRVGTGFDVSSGEIMSVKLKPDQIHKISHIVVASPASDTAWRFHIPGESI